MVEATSGKWGKTRVFPSWWLAHTLRIVTSNTLLYLDMSVLPLWLLIAEFPVCASWPGSQAACMYTWLGSQAACIYTWPGSQAACMYSWPRSQAACMYSWPRSQAACTYSWLRIRSACYVGNSGQWEDKIAHNSATMVSL